MFRNTSVKKALILVVALLLVSTVVFAACSSGDFTPVSMPEKGNVDSNGGSAVIYGDWLYYVNGYTSDTSADNTYTNDVKNAPRVGSVVRIKLAAIEGLFDINDDKDLTSSERTKELAAYIRNNAETVVPKIYYSGNTTTTRYTGIYIFNDRIYVTTPNDELTAGGDTLVNQLVLTSFKLDGSDMKRHYTFTNSAAQIWFVENDSKLVATYLMDSKLYNLDVASGTSTEVTLKDDAAAEVANTVSAVTMDDAGKNVFFIDKFGSIAKLALGATEYDVIVENTDYEVHDHDGEKHIEAGTVSYTINSVNNGQVYYTVADSNNSSISGTVLYWADSNSNGNVALSTVYSSAKGWKDGKVVYTKNATDDYYAIYVTTGDAEEKQIVLSPKFNTQSITLDRIEGDTLYYTANSISYTLDLATADNVKEGAPYARTASTTGWAAPDYITVGDIHYVITLGTGSISIVKFDVVEKTNSSSISMLLTAAPEKE